MSIVECACCGRHADARSMLECESCSTFLCDECARLNHCRCPECTDDMPSYD